ncbi:hypothetical protein CAEBREN_25801 [Caenorhabditis brenneri]|uniref:BTB domain-containing protein n=1 Tax=Caenorhabditis brenneri TaxID=135651 RepID=G0MVX1_CAEBE|nr:hypothetical protein CAEBREN_25801 [Caenorhabditis brenneri]
MTGTSEISIYEKTFAKSDKTDAILVVEGKKLHVNKAPKPLESFMSICESTFAKSEKTDAILVVDGKKLHVNKALKKPLPAEKCQFTKKHSLIPTKPMRFWWSREKKLHVNKAVLSYHSDYFNVLFKEKSMEEIEIEDVKYVDFASVLSLVHNVPIKYSDVKEQLEALLVIADQFHFPAAKRHLELLLIISKENPLKLIGIADKYQLNDLKNIALSKLDRGDYYRSENTSNGFRVVKKPDVELLDQFSKETNIELFHRYLEIIHKISNPPIRKTSKLSIYESTFAKSDKTDAILVVDEKRLHVNKAKNSNFFKSGPVLSYHSDYFNKIFNSKFKEIAAFAIANVEYEKLATVLSLVHGGPIKSSTDDPEKYLAMAERFQLPAAKRHLELFLMINQRSNQKSSLELIEIADKYHLNDLMDIALPQLSHRDYYSDSSYHREPDLKCFEQLSDETNIKLFHRFLEVGYSVTKKPNINNSQLSIYEKTFAKTDKTDAILVVDGKKLHVNKAVLSHHSDYFNVMFNSDFKEKSMKEIEIKDVDFENFATLLSMVHLNPIAPTNKQNAMKIVELSDRFIVPCAKPLLQTFIYTSPLSNVEKIRIGELYDDDELFQEGINAMDYQDFRELLSNPTYEALSSASKRKLFYKSLSKRGF